MSQNITITPKKDIVFKKIFGSRGNEGILKDFLESILDIEIKSVSLDLATELLPDFENGKEARIDVRTSLHDGTQVNVEMQMDTNAYSEQRCLEYWSLLFSNAIEKGDEYKKLKKTICIWILNGLAYNDFAKYHSKWKITETELGLTAHFDFLEFHIIELSKFRNSDIIKPMKKDFWLWFIDHTNKEMINMACDNFEKMEEARKTLHELQADKELMDWIRRRELYEHDQASALNRAEEKGKEAGKIERETRRKIYNS